MNDSKVGVVLAGHGSRDKDAILQFRQIAALVSESQNKIVESGFLEFESPTIGEAIDCAIANGARALVVVPILLNAAHHVKIDIPLIIQEAKKRHPEIPIAYAKHLDLHPKILALYQIRIREALLEEDQKQTALIVIGRGTSDSAANEDILKLKRFLKDRVSFGEILHGYTSIAVPLLPEALEQARKLSYHTILVAPYLLFNGVLAEKVESCAEMFRKNNPGRRVIVAHTLGTDPLARDAILDRINETILLLQNQQKTNNHQKE